jgi:hypothetical protein
VSLDVIVAVGGTAAAVLVSQWPKVAPLLGRRPKPAGGVTYQQALESLAVVRSRLAAPGPVDADVQKAIESITLALVRGSG